MRLRFLLCWLHLTAFSHENICAFLFYLFIIIFFNHHLLKYDVFVRRSIYVMLARYLAGGESSLSRSVMNGWTISMSCITPYLNDDCKV